MRSSRTMGAWTDCARASPSQTAAGERGTGPAKTPARMLAGTTTARTRMARRAPPAALTATKPSAPPRAPP
jgi:hypothetical protein